MSESSDGEGKNLQDGPPSMITMESEEDCEEFWECCDRDFGFGACDGPG